MLMGNVASWGIAFLCVLAPASANPSCSRSVLPDTAFSEFSPDAKVYLQQQYSQLLCNLGEAALPDARGSDFAVRLVVDASWGDGVLVRIEQSGERSAGTRKKWRKAVSADNRPIITIQQQRFAILRADIARLQRAVDDLGLRSPNSVDRLEIVDGFAWFVEIRAGGRHLFLASTSPREFEPIRRFGEMVRDIADVSLPRPRPNEDQQQRQ